MLAPATVIHKSKPDRLCAHCRPEPMIIPGSSCPFPRLRVISSAAAEPSWHVVRNVNESEKRARECLKRSDFEIYYPLQRELRPVPRRMLSLAQRASPFPIMREIDVPLFNRYLFVRMNLRSDRWHDIFGDLGLLGVLCDGETQLPRPFPAFLIDGLKACEQDGAIPARVTVAQLAFKIGELVRITSGPLADQKGVVEFLPELAGLQLWELDESAKVKLLVAMLGGKVPVELPMAHIAKL